MHELPEKNKSKARRREGKKRKKKKKKSTSQTSWHLLPLIYCSLLSMWFPPICFRCVFPVAPIKQPAFPLNYSLPQAPPPLNTHTHTHTHTTTINNSSVALSLKDVTLTFHERYSWILVRMLCSVWKEKRRMHVGENGDERARNWGSRYATHLENTLRRNALERSHTHTKWGPGNAQHTDASSIFRRNASAGCFFLFFPISHQISLRCVFSRP